MADPTTNMEVDQPVLTPAPENGRPHLSPTEAHDLITDAANQPVQKKQKVADKSQVSAGPSQAPPNKKDWGVKLREKLNRARSSIKTVAVDTKKLMEKTSDAELRTHIEKLLNRTNDAFNAVDSLLEKNGNVVDLPRPPSGKSTSDASTDTILTPSWWDSDKAIEARAASRRRLARKPTDAAQQHAPSAETEDDAAMDTDAGGNWAQVAGRRRSRRKTAAPATGSSTTRAPTLPASVAKKPPAVLVKPGEGKTFADTVRAVRSCGFNVNDLGASVSMRETRDGCLLLELPKGSKSSSAAKTIAEALGNRLGDSVGKVSQLGVQVEMEVLDLDAVSSAAEVLEALRAAIPGGEDPAAAAERAAICDVRIWPVRGGQQIATAKMSRYAASVISKVPVGWTMCRVRPRTLPPTRCFRCHAFGHSSRECKAPDRTGACWKCGVIGHSMKDCSEPDDRCVACESAGFPKVAHKPGSGACAARKQSAGLNRGHND